METKFNKPKLMWAYNFLDGMYMIGESEKRVRGYCAEQGTSKRIVRVLVGMERKPRKKNAINT